MKITLDKKERRALNIAVIISILFGMYFFRHFFSIIAVGAIMAYIFHPLREKLIKKTKRPGLSTMLTLVISFLILIIPLLLVVIVTVFQIESMLSALPHISISGVGALGRSVMEFLNRLLSGLPGNHYISAASIATSLQGFTKNAAQVVLAFILASAGGIPRFFTDVILFIFIFASFLNGGHGIIRLIKEVNPLGPKITELYLQKMGDMTKGVIRGQFVIAFCQGLLGAAAFYIIGWHSIFFFMLLILTVLSIIPLGSGILTIPIGLLLIAFGHYWQGALVLFNHIVIVTNIDNFLRARLVPKTAHLNSALMILSVFSGMAMFGFLGIVIGPIIMVLIISTIQVYSSVVSLENDDEPVEAVAKV